MKKTYPHLNLLMTEKMFFAAKVSPLEHVKSNILMLCICSSNSNQQTTKRFPVSEKTYLCEHADTVTSALNV